MAGGRRRSQGAGGGLVDAGVGARPGSRSRAQVRERLLDFYVRYGLPLMVEVQCYEWAEGVDDQSLPRT